MALDPLPAPAWTPADPTALHQALSEAHGAGKLPGPGLGDYLFDLGRWLEERFIGALEKVIPWTDRPIVEQVALYTALGGALVASLAVLVVAIRRWRAARPQPTGGVVTVAAVAGPSTPSGDAAWWKAELERRLAAGALRPALEAAWWWTARRLDPPGLEPSWTTGELLRARPVAALRAPLRRLDRQLWGGALPKREEVDSVVAELGRVRR